VNYVPLLLLKKAYLRAKSVPGPVDEAVRIADVEKRGERVEIVWNVAGHRFILG
jgi:hypothetical protein